MKKHTNYNGHNVFCIVLSIIVIILYFGNDSHYWGLEEKSGVEILTEVGMGKTNPQKVKLTPKQLKEIKSLITLNPSNYNAGQKSLLEDHTAENILTDIGMGKIQPMDVKLTAKEFVDIYRLIKAKPENYNEAQKSLIRPKSGKDILNAVGMGKVQAKDINLTIPQMKEIKDLIENNPNDYNDAQKSLLH